MGRARCLGLLHQLGQPCVGRALVELLAGEVDWDWLLYRPLPDIVSRHVVEEGTRRHLGLGVHEELKLMTWT